MWSAKNVCVCCMYKSQDYNKLNEIVLGFQPLRIYEMLYKTVPSLEQMNKQNHDQFSLPEIICLPCYGNLLVAYKFQEQCLASLQGLYKLWAEHQLETPIASLDELQSKEEIKMERDYVQQNVQEIENDIFQCKLKDIGNKQKKDPPEKEEETDEDLLGEDFSTVEDFVASDEEFCTAKKNVPQIKKSSLNQFQCSTRSKQFKSKHSDNNDASDASNKPKSLSTVEKTVNCSLCSDKFKHRKGLAYHMGKKHAGVSLFECDECNKKFAMEEKFVQHKNSHLGIRMYQCKECPKAFNSNSHLKQHMRGHTSATPYLCTICGKSFSRCSALIQHNKWHSDEKPYKCKLCPKTFKLQSGLYLHMPSHSKEQKFECKTCGSRFKRADTLRDHQILHSGTKPFKCEECGKGFNSMSNMRRHRRVHTGEKPFKCEYCDYAFSQSNDMKKHMRCHGRDNVYECDECSERFKYQADLRHHKSEHYVAKQSAVKSDAKTNGKVVKAI